MTGWLLELGAARVFVTIQADNAASAAVARRAGFTHEGTLRASDVAVLEAGFGVQSLESLFFQLTGTRLRDEAETPAP